MIKVNQESLVYDYINEITNTGINDVCSGFKQSRVCCLIRDDNNLLYMVKEGSLNQNTLEKGE